MKQTISHTLILIGNSQPKAYGHITYFVSLEHVYLIYVPINFFSIDNCVFFSENSCQFDTFSLVSDRFDVLSVGFTNNISKNDFLLCFVLITKAILQIEKDKRVDPNTFKLTDDGVQKPSRPVVTIDIDKSSEVIQSLPFRINGETDSEPELDIIWINVKPKNLPKVFSKIKDHKKEKFK